MEREREDGEGENETKRSTKNEFFYLLKYMSGYRGFSKLVEIRVSLLKKTPYYPLKTHKMRLEDVVFIDNKMI